jgi:hypothetical protein
VTVLAILRTLSTLIPILAAVEKNVLYARDHTLHLLTLALPGDLNAAIEVKCGMKPLLVSRNPLTAACHQILNLALVLCDADSFYFSVFATALVNHDDTYSA